MAKGSSAKPGWIRFRRASLRLGAEELDRGRAWLTRGAKGVEGESGAVRGVDRRREG